MTRPAEQPRLRKLEAARGFAACYVFAGHFANTVLGNPPWCLPFRFSAEAVVLFFVLSGFVIHHTTFAKDRNVCFRDYLIKRFRRIYPLFVASLIASYVCTCVALRRVENFDVGSFLANLLMLQDFKSGKPGVAFGTFHNGALWSLSYEWWFYMLFFPIERFIRSRNLRRALVAAISLVGTISFWVFPNQISLFAMLFVIWWAGVEMSEEYSKNGAVTVAGQKSTIVFVVAAGLFWLLGMWWTGTTPNTFGYHPILQLRQFAGGALIVISAAVWCRFGFVGFDRMFSLFALVAPISYAIYIFHLPLMTVIESIPELRNPLIAAPMSAILVLAVAYVMELKLQPRISALFQPLLRGSENRAKVAAVQRINPTFAARGDMAIVNRD